MKNKSLLMTIAILIIGMSSIAQIKRTNTDKRDNRVEKIQKELYETFTDSRDGKTYKTIKIGTQKWMAENLAYKPSIGFWRTYDDNVTNVAKYGYLYNWETAKIVCPSGWHLPSDAEWTMLITYLGGESIAGGKLKEPGTTHWQSPNTGATNIAGFRALPGGECAQDGTYVNLGVYGQWWSTTEINLRFTYGARYFRLNYYNTVANFVLGDEDVGMSVRCVCNPNQVFALYR